jgi:hypothetical protein
MNGGLWTARVAGLPCTAQTGVDGDWIVTIARASVGRHENLAEAILLAAGGLATHAGAEALAASIRARQRVRKSLTNQIGRRHRTGRRR